MPEPDILAPLRKLTDPDQVAALMAECTDLGRRVAQLPHEARSRSTES